MLLQGLLLKFLLQKPNVYDKVAFTTCPIKKSVLFDFGATQFNNLNFLMRWWLIK